jgi:hypothetical protein
VSNPVLGKGANRLNINPRDSLCHHVCISLRSDAVRGLELMILSVNNPSASIELTKEGAQLTGIT